MAIFNESLIIKGDFPLGEHVALLKNIEATLTKEGKPILILMFENQDYQKRVIFNAENTDIRNTFRAVDFTTYVLKPLSNQLDLGKVDAEVVLEKALNKEIKIKVSNTMVKDTTTGEVKQFTNVNIV